MKLINRALERLQNINQTRINTAAVKNHKHLQTVNNLTPYSTAVAAAYLRHGGITHATSDQAKRQRTELNLLLNSGSEADIYAGVHTAIKIAAALAGKLGLVLNIISLKPIPIFERIRKESIKSSLEARFSCDIGAILDTIEYQPSKNCLWVATHWFTAHSLQVACHNDFVRTEDVVYLIQDYEPGFVPWSTYYALARSTYHANFKHLINSKPLAEFLQRSENLEVDKTFTFAPAIDTKLALAIRQRRQTKEQPERKVMTVAFYGRPSKARNLFDIGVAALKNFVGNDKHADTLFDCISIGEAHSNIQLSPNTKLRSLAKLEWDQYFKLLGQVDILLTLQHSPHPSHPPFDAVLCGAVVVTNEFAGTRGNLHDNIITTEPWPEALSDGMSKAYYKVLLQRKTTTNQAESTQWIESLGNPLETTVDSLVDQIRLAG